MSTPRYIPPRTSFLEPVRAEIADLRKANWPYRAIQEWLLTEKGLKCDHTNIISFCKVRGIKKGRGETTEKPKVEVRRFPQQAQKTERIIQEGDIANHTRARLDGDDFDFGA